MATKIYSDWKSSRFSCWWNIQLELPKEQQLLHICVYLDDDGEGRTYQEISSQGCDACAIAIVNQPSAMSKTLPTSEQHCQELAVYLNAFMRDVDSAYAN